MCVLLSTSLLTACLYLPALRFLPSPLSPTLQPWVLLQVHFDQVVLLHCSGLLLAEATLIAAKLAVQSVAEAEAPAATAAAPQPPVPPPTQAHTVAHPPNHLAAAKPPPALSHAHHRAPASSQIQAGGKMLGLCQTGFSQWMWQWIWVRSP